MSMHNIPLTDIEREGLKNHGLGRNIGKPSQLADCFRQGVKWGQEQERSRLRAENTALQSGYDAARLEIASLRAKLATFDSASAVRRDQDAARYRWLNRKVGVYLTGIESEPVSWYLFCKNPVSEELVEETHKAIDTAIASIKKG